MMIIHEPWDGRKSHRFLSYYANEYWRVESEKDMIPAGHYWVLKEENSGARIFMPTVLVNRMPQMKWYWTTPCGPYPDPKSEEQFRECTAAAINQLLKKHGLKATRDPRDKAVYVGHVYLSKVAGGVRCKPGTECHDYRFIRTLW